MRPPKRTCRPDHDRHSNCPCPLLLRAEAGSSQRGPWENTRVTVSDEIALKSGADWQRLREERLTTVLDPMIFRAAELFLAGRRSTSSADETWQALSANLAGLAAFFDAIVLHERLPIFDYDITFPEGPELGAFALGGLVSTVNAEQEVLAPVRVSSAAYAPLKQAALEELRAQPGIPADERASVLSELTVFDYRWTPSLEGFDDAPDDERRLSTFLYGGLLFSAYAQELRGTHMLQQKRARVFSELALGTAADDQVLFARLAGLADAAPDAVSTALDIPSLPSFIPYLLHEAAEDPRAMLAKALEMRADPDVLAYREWHNRLLDDLAQGGNALEQRAEIDEVRGALERKLAGRAIPVKVSVSMIALAIPVLKVESQLEADIRPRAAWGWGVRRVTGDHRKVLMRLLGAKQAYRRLDLKLREVWDRG